MKKTPLVKKVLELLQESQKPLSVPNLQELLQARSFAPNKTTLYRMLERLVAENQVEALLLDPKVTYYELRSHHHHHFKCGSCNAIECVTDPKLEQQIHALEEQLGAKGLKVEHHHFSLSGTCSTCT